MRVGSPLGFLLYGVLVGVRLVAEGASEQESTRVNETIAWEQTDRDVCHTFARVHVDALDLFNMSNLTVLGLRPTGGLNPANEPLDATVYTKVQATRRRRRDDSEVVWFGMMADAGRFGFATLLWHGKSHERGTLVGTFTTELAAFEVDQNTAVGDTAFRVRCSYWSDDEEVTLSNIKMGDEVGDSTVSGNSNPHEPHPDVTKAFAIVPDHSGTVTTSYGTGAALWRDTFNQSLVRADSSLRKLQTDTTVVVSILVIVSKRAMCDAAGLARRCDYNETVAQPIIDKIALAEQQTVVALQTMGVTVRVAQIMFLTDNYDPVPNGDALDFLRRNHVIQQRRNDVKANLLLMVAGARDRGGAAGIGTINGAESVVTVDGMSQFTFTHEIGHNFGCRHDRESTDKDHSYAHGLQIPFQFRTVMSYRCDGNVDHCPRVPLYSAQGQSLNGVALGDARHDNARMIRDNARKVSQWNSRPTCTSDAQAQQCPGQNLMKKRRLFLFCTETCVDQTFLWARRLLGWSCGGCD